VPATMPTLALKLKRRVARFDVQQTKTYTTLPPYLPTSLPPSLCCGETMGPPKHSKRYSPDSVEDQFAPSLLEKAVAGELRSYVHNLCRKASIDNYQKKPPRLSSLPPPPRSQHEHLQHASSCKPQSLLEESTVHEAVSEHKRPLVRLSTPPLTACGGGYVSRRASPATHTCSMISSRRGLSGKGCRGWDGVRVGSSENGAVRCSTATRFNFADGAKEAKVAEQIPQGTPSKVSNCPSPEGCSFARCANVEHVVGIDTGNIPPRRSTGKHSPSARDSEMGSCSPTVASSSLVPQN